MDLLRLTLVRFGLFAILISAPTASGFTRLQKEEGRDHAKELTYALSALSSGTDLERSAARETLLGLGQSAMPPLLDLLKSLTPNVEVCPPGSNLPCRTTNHASRCRLIARSTARGECRSAANKNYGTRELNWNWFSVFGTGEKGAYRDWGAGGARTAGQFKACDGAPSKFRSG